MTEKPIIFSGPMVRAILDGRKTMTRRVLTTDTNMSCEELAARCRCPYGRAGDRLWVRETHALDTWWPDTSEANILFRSTDPRMGEAPEHIVKLDEAGIEWANRQHKKQVHSIPVWQPSIHMPRWASRITLDVTAVRVERLHEISAYDVVNEGVNLGEHKCDCEFCSRTSALCTAAQSSLMLEWIRLWDSINGKRPGCSWDANPWVFVIEFQRAEAKRSAAE